MQPQVLAAADDAEAARHVERDAGLVFGKDARLKRPDACLFGALDQRRKQRPADALAARTTISMNKERETQLPSSNVTQT